MLRHWQLSSKQLPIPMVRLKRLIGSWIVSPHHLVGDLAARRRRGYGRSITGKAPSRLGNTTVITGNPDYPGNYR